MNRQDAPDASDRRSPTEAMVPGEATWEWDLTADRVLWSQAQYRLFGLTPGEVQPSLAALQSCFHPDDVVLVLEAIQAGLRTGAPFGLDLRVVWRDASVHPIHMEGAFVRDSYGRPARLVASCRDLSQPRPAPVPTTPGSDRLTDASTAARFLADMSHQMRTPLTSVVGMARLLEDTNLTVDQQDYVETIRNSSEHLLTILNDLSDMSRLDAGRLVLQRDNVHVRPLLRQAINIVLPRASERSINFREEIALAVPAVVEGDETRIRQVLLNVLTEAARRSHGTQVAVQADVLPRRPQGIVLHIAVRCGNGNVPRETLERIFEVIPDVEGGELDRRTGLGMALSRRLAETMGGHLWADAPPGSGLTLHFEFPTRELAQIARVPGPAVIPAVPPVRVLLVEDNAVNQKVTAKMLERMGVRADLCNNGQEALALLRNKSYDVVLMDVQMPMLDGLATTKALRTSEAGTRHTQVIAMTAHALPGDREKCLKAGMDDYVSKPVRLEDLSEAVVKAARRAGVVP